MKKSAILAVVFLCCLSFHGCMVTAILGADHHVRVNNHTDEHIRVKTNGEIFGDAGLFNLDSRAIESGGSADFIIDGFEIDPAIKVEYRGLMNEYPVESIFIGFDVIDVETSDFPIANG